MAEDNPTSSSLSAGGDNAEKTEPAEFETPGYWFKWIKAAKDAADRHWQDARNAYKEYDNDGGRSVTEGADQIPVVYPMYWSSSKVLEPALYSRTPKPSTITRFGWRDDSARRMATITERLGDYLLETSHFDEGMIGGRNDLIHADKGTTQVCYECDLVDDVERVPLSPVPSASQAPAEQRESPEEESSESPSEEMSETEPQFQDSSGNLYPDEVKLDDQGHFGEKPIKKAVNQRIYLKPICFDEILHTPDAKSEMDIDTKAYYFTMPRKDAEKRFGDAVKSIAWKTKKDIEGQDKMSLVLPGEYLDGWEIYYKPEKRIYWLSESKRDAFLDATDDQLDLDGFFPSPPFIINSKPRKSLYPTPAYTQVAATCRQLHKMYARVFSLIDGVRRRCLVDGNEPELLAALQDLDGSEFIAVSNLQKLVEKGGMQNLLIYVDVQELVTAIGELMDLDQKFQDLFYNFFGVPDILRGTSDPAETAEAQVLKKDAAHSRFEFVKTQIAQLARDSLRLLVDVALKVFDDQKMMEVCGFNYMDPVAQQSFAMDLQTLRDDTQRVIRIDIETDTLTFQGMQLKEQQTQAVTQAVTQGLQEISQMTQQSPVLANAAMQILMASLEEMPMGRNFQDTVKEVSGQLAQAAQQAAQQQQAPPTPSPDEQLKAQIAQENNQAQAASDNIKLQISQGDNAAKIQIAEMQYNEKIQEYQGKMEVQEAELNLQAQQQQLDARFQAIEETIKQTQAQIDTFDEVRKAQAGAQPKGAAGTTVIVGGNHRAPVTKDVEFIRHPVTGDLMGARITESPSGPIQAVDGATEGATTAL